MATAEAIRPARQRQLTSRDWDKLRDLTGCDENAEIPTDIVDACLKRQAIYHRRASGPLPQGEINKALESCGLQVVGKLVRQMPVAQVEPDDEVETNWNDVGGGDNLTTQDKPTEPTTEKVVEDTPKNAGWDAVEQGAAVVVMTDDGVKRGAYQSRGPGGRLRVRIVGDEAAHRLFDVDKVELQELPPENKD